MPSSMEAAQLSNALPTPRPRPCEQPRPFLRGFPPLLTAGAHGYSRRITPSWARGSACLASSGRSVHPQTLSLPQGSRERGAHRFCGGDDLAGVLAHKLALAQIPRAAQAPAPVACAWRAL